MQGDTLLWIIFGAAVAIVLYVDLFVLHKKTHAVPLRQALSWSALWISLALLFNLGIFLWDGSTRGLNFLTAYVIELSLSVDNLFVFLLIFSYFRVPAQYQHKVLMWGILGAIAMRAILITSGIALLESFDFIIYVFGSFLIYSGLRMLRRNMEETDPGKSIPVRLVSRILPTTSQFETNRFFIRKAGRLMATPLVLVLIAIETSDLIFAVDSIPAVLSITSDTFVVYTSNIFAILGLRSLYFALAGVMRLFKYLRYGLALVLVLVGSKMAFHNFYEMPVSIALGIVVLILAVTILASLLHRDQPADSTTPNKSNTAR